MPPQSEIASYAPVIDASVNVYFQRRKPKYVHVSFFSEQWTCYNIQYDDTKASCKIEFDQGNSLRGYKQFEKYTFTLNDCTQNGSFHYHVSTNGDENGMYTINNIKRVAGNRW